MYNNRALEVVGVFFKYPSMCGMLFEILNMSPPKTNTTKRQQKYNTLDEKSKYLFINKYGNIAMFKIFSFHIQNIRICILETIFPHSTTKLLKIWAFWVI